MGNLFIPAMTELQAFAEEINEFSHLGPAARCHFHRRPCSGRVGGASLGVGWVYSGPTSALANSRALETLGRAPEGWGEGGAAVPS